MPTLRNAGRTLAAALVAVGVLAAGAPAEAAGSKEVQALKALKKALDEDYLQTRFDAAEQKLRAALQSCGKACSVGTRVKLHLALGAVLAGGKKELEDARDAFVEALTLDPKSVPNPDLLSTEVSFAYEQARKKLRLAPGPGATADAKPPKKPAPAEKVEKVEKVEKDEPDEKPAAVEKVEKADKADKAEPEAPPDPPPPPEPVRKNWLTLSIAPDLAVLSGTNVCSSAGQASSHFVCLRQNSTRYEGTPTLDNGDNINQGVALATLRVMLGYDRLVHPNLTVGLRAGFAFNGASGGGSSFMPAHVEGRFGIWPGHEPFVGRGVRPFFMVSGGLAQVDAKVSVQVLEDGTACGAANPASTSSPCTMPSRDGTVEPRVQTLAVFKQTGLGFASLAFGVQFAPSTRVALHLAARASVMFPVVAPVISPEGGLSVGF